MRVTLVGEMSGTRDGQQWPPRGSTVDLPDDEATQMCRHGMAVPFVEPEAGVERAVPPVEAVEQRTPLTTKSGPGRRKPPAEPS